MNGILTSFNIEELDTGYWTKIEEVYAKNEDIVKENQKLLKVSNEDASGTIYSTIGGKFFIEENTDKDKYFIYDLYNVGIEIDVEENDSVKLKLGQKANINFTAMSESFEGRICYISKIPIDGIVKVKIKINYTDTLKFGCTAKAEILLNEEIDTSIKEYDIKNSFKKIGKTKISLKNQISLSEGIAFDEYSFGMGEFSDYTGEIPEEFEYDIDEISEYYSNLWDEYWNSYWKAYYEEYQTYQVIEPTDKSDLIENIDKEVNHQEDIEGE